MKTIKSTILLAGLFLLISCVSDNPIKDEPQIRVTGLTINKSSTSIVEGGSETLIVTISPDKAANKNVLWSSQDVSVATVSEGKITAVKAGTSIITATTVDGGIKAICTVTVTTQAISVTGLTLDKTEVSINVGKTEVLVPTITPTNATNHEITWVSSNVSVATIKNGIITAIAKGSATITATTVDGGKKATCTVNVTTIPSVYISGKLNEKAAIWKDGIATVLSEKQSGAYSVFVSGNDVYAAGWETGKWNVATVWKNGMATALGNGTYNSVAESLFVVGNDVYVAGLEDNGKFYVATVWKNGIAMELADGKTHSEASSVFVSGNDVYVVGTVNTHAYTSGSRAVIWKNGVATLLAGGTNFVKALSVFVSGNDVYVVGSDGPNAILWKNGVATILKWENSIGMEANCIYVADGDVYVTGSGGGHGDNSVVWKNGVATALTDGKDSSHARSLFVYDTDVYVTGWAGVLEKVESILWKNGVATVFNEKKAEVMLYDVFVK